MILAIGAALVLAFGAGFMFGLHCSDGGSVAPFKGHHRKPYRWSELAEYNKQVAEGLVHTPEHKQRMALQQRYFDEEVRRKCKEEGGIIVGGD